MSITIGILYPGELGAAMASMFRRRGLRVVTTVSDRSAATILRARSAEIEILDSLAAVIQQSDGVISLVPPSAAEDQAAQYCNLAKLAPRGAIYVDCNSIGPERTNAIASRVRSAGLDFIDAAVNGLAKNLTTSGTLFLSGKRAAELAAWIGDTMRVHVLGAEPGAASTMKMLLAGLSKGICALYLELALVAQRYNVAGELSRACQTIYPGVLALVERMLPTYAEHASRRATEMQELETTARSAGIDPCVIDAIRCLHDFLSREDFSHASIRSAEALIQYVGDRGFLAAQSRDSV